MFPLRDENPSHGTPFVTVLLILANVGVFFYETALGNSVEHFISNFALIPARLHPGSYSEGAVPPLLTFVTSMFLHGGWGHLLGNMWFLWLFGDNLEEFLGHAGFLLFYLVTGIVAGAVHVVLNLSSEIPTLGASGAVSGVLGGYLVLFPRIRIRTLIFLGFFINVVRVPAIFFLGIWFVMQLMGGLGGDAGVAFGAHVGGFVAGAAILFFLSRGRPRSAHEARYEPHRLPRW